MLVRGGSAYACLARVAALATELKAAGLPMKPGRAGTMTHDYKRNGTTDLFAALNVGTGEGSSVLEVIDAIARAKGIEITPERGERRAGDPARGPALPRPGPALSALVPAAGLRRPAGATARRRPVPRLVASGVPDRPTTRTDRPLPASPRRRAAESRRRRHRGAHRAGNPRRRCAELARTSPRS